jgi:glutathione S-transferase
MSLFRDAAGGGATPGALADIARIDTLWREALTRHGGPFLFGSEFGNADAMFAPVVARFLTYRPALSPDAQAYCAAVRGHPLVGAWYDAAAAEPASWFIAAMETPVPPASRQSPGA